MTDKTTPDKLFASPLSEIVDFVFDEKVVDVFPDMINRSVPGYSTIINLLGIIARHYARPGTNIYDLGSSLGAATLSMRHHVTVEGCKIIAVDNASAMIERLQRIIERDNSRIEVESHCKDLQAIDIHNASVVVMNFTLQFIALEERDAIIEKIYRGMNPGGVLVLSEKLLFEDEQEDRVLTELHHAFKKSNGYSDLEIAQKRSALENVLIPETADIHHQRLQRAGFSEVYPWFQCFNFASFIAIK